MATQTLQAESAHTTCTPTVRNLVEDLQTHLRRVRSLAIAINDALDFSASDPKEEVIGRLERAMNLLDVQAEQEAKAYHLTDCIWDAAND